MTNLSLSRFAGMNIHYCHFSFEYFLDSMVRLGFNNIEIWGASPHIYFEDLTVSSMKKIKRQIKARNLNVICFTPEQCVYPVNIAAKESEIRNRSINYFYKNIEISAELNIPIMLVTPGWGYFSESKKDAWNISLDSLRKLSLKAKQLGIILALEPISHFNSNIVNDVFQLKKMLNLVNSSNLKGMLDLGQMAILDEKIEDYLINLKNDLIHIHFIDSNKDGAHLALGDGNLPLMDYIKKISSSGYGGYLTLEIADKMYYLEPEEALKKSIEKLKLFL